MTGGRPVPEARPTRSSVTIDTVEPADNAVWGEIQEILLAAAQRSFPDRRSRRAFFLRWTEYYRNQEPEQCLICRSADQSVAGYLTGCLNSGAALQLYRDIPSHRLFEDHFEGFPAHFHVNCRSDARQQGIGSALVKRFLAKCRTSGLPGVHVVTAAGADNVAFYRGLGFEPIEERSFDRLRRLLLGLRLD